MFHKAHIVLIDVWRVINAKGGTGRVFCNMANELLARGYAVTAICFDKEQGQPGYQVSKGVNLVNAYEKGGFFQGHLWKMLSCFSLDKDVRKKKRLLFKDTQMASSIGKVISELKQVDLFISFEPEATFILRDLLGISKPVVTMYHLPIPKFEESFDFKYFFKSAVTSLSPSLARAPTKWQILTSPCPAFCAAIASTRAAPVLIISPLSCPFTEGIFCTRRLASAVKVLASAPAFLSRNGKNPSLPASATNRWAQVSSWL